MKTTALLCALAAPLAAATGGELGHVGSFAKWAKVEIALHGPPVLTS